MSNKYVFYDKQTGQVFMQLYCLEEDLKHYQIKDYEMLEGIFLLDNQYIDPETAEIRDIPPKPNDYSEFNWQTKQWEDNLELLKNQINSKRLQLLQQSDWTDTVSAQTRLTNYEEWQTYRQALRDITKQEGYPLNIVWPSQPN